MVNVHVDFSKAIREWDGFGINYVAAAQTRDYDEWPQDYGAFDLLTERDRQAIIDLVFGDQGLQPTIGKMFIDSLQAGKTRPAGAPSDPYTIDYSIYDHERTTRWMRYFMCEGLKRVRDRRDPFEIVATLYGPAGWMTRQKIVRGRDLDPQEKYELAKYMISFAQYMRDREGLPVRYLSLFNEGEVESAGRWPDDGGDTPEHLGHDYNMLWTVEQVVDFMKFMPNMIERLGIRDLSVTNGECTLLGRATKYTEAIAHNPECLARFRLFTSHGFGEGATCFTDEPLRPLRAANPAFRGWVTSATWGGGDWPSWTVLFSRKIHDHVGDSAMNGYIPWAAVQRHSQWYGGDPNPRCAILVDDNGSWQVQKEYYIYKHWCRIGKARMGVAEQHVEGEGILATGFGANGTGHPDALVITNTGDSDRQVKLNLAGTGARVFTCVLTDRDRIYQTMPQVRSGATLESPAQSIMTLQASE